MTIYQIIPIAISSFALILSFYTYIKHDKKIKRQSELINDFQITKLRKEAETEKKAIIEANVIKGEKGKRIIKVYNKGKSFAKNVIVSFSGEPNISFMDYPNSIDLRPKNSMEIILYVFKGSPDILEINFEWEDRIKKDNKDSQILQI